MPGEPVRVSAAIEAAGGAGARPFTYHVPPRLGALEPGEAVLVEFGRRQAVGIVLGSAVAPEPGVETKPVLERVPAGGAPLPALRMPASGPDSGYLLGPPGPD